MSSGASTRPGGERSPSRATPPRPPSGGDRGTALIATLVLGLALGGVAAVASLATHETGRELRVRRDALCAHYAALAGLALGPSPADLADVVDATVESLRAETVLRAPGWCVVRSVAHCERARRVLERTVAPAHCGA